MCQFDFSFKYVSLMYALNDLNGLQLGTVSRSCLQLHAWCVIRHYAILHDVYKIEIFALFPRIIYTILLAES